MGARDRYVWAVVGAVDPDAFVADEAPTRLTARQTETALTLLELQRYVMSTFTSCGWFFNDVGGIETVQIIKYAARAVELLELLGQPSPEPALLSELELARSNAREVGTAADIFRSLRRAQPRRAETG